MDTIVDRIRLLCKENGTSITKIESELGYANGTIGKWRNGKRTPPLEKLLAISERLKTSPDYLLTGEQAKKDPTPVSESGSLYPPAYDKLTSANKAIVDRLIADLVKNQSPD